MTVPDRLAQITERANDAKEARDVLADRIEQWADTEDWHVYNYADRLLADLDAAGFDVVSGLEVAQILKIEEQRDGLLAEVERLTALVNDALTYTRLGMVALDLNPDSGETTAILSALVGRLVAAGAVDFMEEGADHE